MKKNRGIKELLTLLKDEVETAHEFDGLCSSLFQLFISNKEIHDLKVFIRENRPFTLISYDPLGGIYLFTKGSYWWKRGDKAPRLKWLDKMIKKQ